MKLKSKRLINFILLFFIFQGCTSIDKTKLAVVALSDQKTDPYGAVVSDKKNMISISCYSDLDFMKDCIIFKSIIKNGGEMPIKISSNNISVSFKENSKNWEPKKVHVLTLDEFIRISEDNFQDDEVERINKILQEMEKTAREMDGAYDRKAIAEMFAFRFIKIVDRIHLKHDQFNGRDVIYLKEQNIIPGESISAIFACDTGKILPGIKGEFIITILMDSEEHNFTFLRS